MEAVAKFTGEIPRIYEEKLGPLLFHSTAAYLGELVRVRTGGRVLEVACGTGIATEALRRVLPIQTEIVATDLNPDMLGEAVARRGQLPNVSFHEADAQRLPFGDGSFDAVVCQFGLQFFPDRGAALREAVRVTRPGGQVLFSTWGSLEVNPPVHAVHDALRKLFPEDPPRFLETPFGLYDHDTLVGLFEAAETRRIAIETFDHVVELPSARDPACGLIRGNPGVLEIEDRAGPTLDEVVDAAEAAIATRLGDAPVRAPLQAIFVSGQR